MRACWEGSPGGKQCWKPKQNKALRLCTPPVHTCESSFCDEHQRGASRKQMQPSPPSNPFVQTGVILLICAALLSLGLFTKSWATATEGRDSIGAGLFSFEGCNRGRCETLTWEFAERRLDIPSIVNTLRIPGMFLGILAAAGMAIAGILALRGEAQKIPVAPIAAVTGGAAVLLTFFATQLALADKDVNFGPDYSAVFGIGAALAGSTVIQKKLKPLLAAHGVVLPLQTPTPQQYQHQQYQQQQQQYQYQQQQQQYQQQQQQYQQQHQQHAGAVPACQRCGQAQHYWAEQQRYYCTSCRV